MLKASVHFLVPSKMYFGVIFWGINLSEKALYKERTEAQGF